MVRKLVSRSIPIVHHVTIPCSESLLVSSSEGTVAVKVPCLAALSALLLFLRVVLDFPTGLDTFGILLPMHVSALPETRDYLPNGCLFSGPPWDMILHFLCNPIVCIHSLQGLLPFHEFDALECPLGVEQAIS